MRAWLYRVVIVMSPQGIGIGLTSMILVMLAVACQPHAGHTTLPNATSPRACDGREGCTDLDLRYERATAAAADVPPRRKNSCLRTSSTVLVR